MTTKNNNFNFLQIANIYNREFNEKIWLPPELINKIFSRV